MANDVCVWRSDSFSHPGTESLSLWSVLPPTHGCHMRMATALRTVTPTLMAWWVLHTKPTQISLFCLMSATLCVIVAFTDIAISCQIKRAILLIFSNRNCLINKQALICTDDHTATQLHQIAQPAMPRHIVLITEWQLLPGVVYINAARLWKGIIVVLNAVEVDRIHFLTCRGQRWWRGLCRSLYTRRPTGLFAPVPVRTCGHMNTNTPATLHIEMIVSCLCQVVFFSPAMETSSWEIEQFLIENSAGN